MDEDTDDQIQTGFLEVGRILKTIGFPIFLKKAAVGWGLKCAFFTLIVMVLNERLEALFAFIP